ncbi:HesA/MoeB/ThiF family protein [Thalassovita mediterranea]|uniref:Molybdopterin-synthase adenylyltransferase n=1 Tax=Thalassovita mediterranea TaxID=340021 RepID=A0A0N7M1T2_9RHOB|nr:HesA/MoeB/ThiF family protein [Thalassovita mediterranea]CUH84179.1 Molybdopterin-synthase adenylyltransferase [Thalassovita mediterranea]SIS27600.1 Molybdopterin or thiamine biosynthesis adenylyltransferase [Thalassovita mediterranea]
MSRYSRQEQLPEVGASGQARLRAARVLVVGCGGLGATVIPALAGAGVGHLSLIDGDVIEESNLHRQTLFRHADLGRPKAVVAAEAVLGLNPEVSVSAQVAYLDAASVAASLQGVDLVVDAADSFAATYTLSDACLSAGVPLISASVLGRSGYVGGFCGGAPSYRALFPDLPTQRQTCVEAGVMGPAVATLGALQAQMALSCLLGLEPSPLGQMMQVDLAAWRVSSFRFEGAPEVTGHRFVSVDQITAQDRVIELRPEAEAPLPHPQSIRLGMEALTTLPITQARTVLTCRSGLRAWAAADQLVALGHSDLVLWAAGE